MGRGRCLPRVCVRLVDWGSSGRKVRGSWLIHTGERFVGCGDKWHVFILS